MPLMAPSAGVSSTVKYERLLAPAPYTDRC